MTVATHLSQEMLATADALRNLRWQIAFLTKEGEMSPFDENVETVLHHALAVSDALEGLAQKLGTQ